MRASVRGMERGVGTSRRAQTRNLAVAEKRKEPFEQNNIGQRERRTYAQVQRARLDNNTGRAPCYPHRLARKVRVASGIGGGTEESRESLDSLFLSSSLCSF